MLSIIHDQDVVSDIESKLYEKSMFHEIMLFPFGV